MRHEPIKIAILAMGGEGGGVLADWIVDLGEHNGWFAQTTSVPGVAQRTGATVYYVELFPGASEPGARAPVLSQAPLPGDLDIVLASELMEAGRAVQRGFVTPDNTTLLSSTHRVYSIAEKSAMGDGRVDSDTLLRQTRRAAKRFVSFNMEQVAERTGSVISAVLFGALSGTGVLPFSRVQFEQTIERGGVGVKPSLKAFAAGFAEAGDALAGKPPQAAAAGGALVWPRHPALDPLVERAQALPAGVSAIALEGIRRLVDYQDPAYARLYLDRLADLAAAPGGHDTELLRETARYLALWMSYEDTMRVADLKTRGSRFDRVRDEVRSQGDQVLEIEEFMHPRLEEICETLPAGLGHWLSRPHAVNRFVARFTQQGRVIRTSSLTGFLLLYGLARWGRWRRTTLRYAIENGRIEAWLARLRVLAAVNPQLALEAARCQRLVKGYSDTHARGLRNYETLMSVVDRHPHALAPLTLKELRDAALADEHGHQLDACLKRLALMV
uniref:Putative indolepyruvate oxidoreductase subunit B n=1 Tax=Variovorax paradoxus (strain S110) TaxID=543728 RepID=C5CLC1_VARPS